MVRNLLPFVIMLISQMLFACAAPSAEPSPPAMLSATDVPPTLASEPTASPTMIPPSPTAILEPITQENLWDLNPRYTFPGLGNSIRAVAFDPSGLYLAAITGGSSLGTDHSIRLWSTATGELLKQSEELGTDLWDIAFSPKGDSLAVGLQNGGLTIYAIPELSTIQSFGHTGQVNTVAYSPDGIYIAAGVAEAEGGMIYLWNTEQGVLVRRQWAHPYSVPSLAFSNNGQYLASGAVDRSVKIWQVSNGQLVRTLEQAGQGLSVRFSLDSTWLGSGMCAQSTSALRCIDGQVWLWSVGDWALDKKLTGPVDWIEAIAFSPDGSLVMGAGRDFALYFWDRSSGALLRSIAGHQGVVQGLALSPDARFLASAATDESVILWAISP